MSVDVNRAEFFCPLCKSLSNTLIAHIPPVAQASTLSSSNSNPTPVSNATGSATSTGSANDAEAERRAVERLSTADGLAEWVLLEEDGGAGVLTRGHGGAAAEAAAVAPRGDRDDDDDAMELDDGGGGGVVAATAAAERGKGTAAAGTLKFGSPRSGLGGALVAGVVRHRAPPVPPAQQQEGEEETRERRDEGTATAGGGGGGAPPGFDAVAGVALDRLAESLETASSPPWAREQQKQRNIEKVSRLRLLHQMWSAAGYTAAAAEAASRAEGAGGGGGGVDGGGSSHAGEAFRGNESLHLRRLLRVVEHGASLLDHTNDVDAAATPAVAASTAALAGEGEAPAAAAAAAAGPVAGGNAGAVSAAQQQLQGAAAVLQGDGDGRDGSSSSSRATTGGSGGVVVAAAAPVGGVVAAIKLGRIFGGAAVVPPPEGIRTSSGGGGGVGSRGQKKSSFVLSPEEATWIRRGLELPMQAMGNTQPALKEADKRRLESFRLRQAYALKRPREVARECFEEATTGGATSKTSSWSERLSPESASALESVWESDAVWPLMQTPLLSWDLTTLLVGGVSMARSWSNRAGVARAVCLARLCQALLQPELCLRGPGGSAAAAASAAGGGRKSGGGRRPGLSKGTAAAASALELLRGVLAEATGTPVSRLAPVGKELVSMCYSSWAPFLRCCALLLVASCSTDNGNDPSDANRGSASGGAVEDEWRQRLASAYGSSARLSFTTTGYDSNGHTRKRRNNKKPAAPAAAASSAATTTTLADDGGASEIDDDDGDGDDGGGVECLAAVLELCSAMGVPSPQAVVSSNTAMGMVRAWGRQYKEAFGPAQPKAGVCRIGSEVP
ncbi:unnamed protein product [Ectocarpus sp. 4 AP-2014]